MTNMKNSFNVIDTLRENSQFVDPNLLTPTQRRRFSQVTEGNLSRTQIALSESVTPRAVGNTLGEIIRIIERGTDYIVYK
jgi:hypothetical protein